MKRLLSLVTVFGAFALMPVHIAGARDHRGDGHRVGYTPCGKPIYAYHEVVGRDRCGRNIWEWVTHYPSSCHCRDHHHRGHDRGYCDSRRNTYRPGGWSFFRF